MTTSLATLIRHTIDSSKQVGNVTAFPSLLVFLPNDELNRPRESGTTMADVALGYLLRQGFKCDRTRMNMYGYPGLFRELSDPPPWVHVEVEDIYEPISPERTVELTPLYIQANQRDLDDLLTRYRRHLADLGQALEGAGIAPPSAGYGESLVKMLEEVFKEKLLLARCIGIENFEQLFAAVFDFDDITLSIGAPDLFVWEPRSSPPLWFFAEVKGPNDHLRQTQIDWIRSNWERIKGNFLLMILSQ